MPEYHLAQRIYHMTAKYIYSCSECPSKSCRSKEKSKYPSFCLTDKTDPALVEEVLAVYRNNKLILDISRESACIEGEYYCRLTRVEETIEFIKRMNFRYVGIASCVGLLEETRMFAKILRGNNIRCYTVGCKIGAVDKTAVGVPDEKKINHGCEHESMCNPILQARVLDAEGTDFNIVIGLCVGHDTLFSKYSTAPTTVMIVKDRVLAHNPVAALYSANSMYSRFKNVLKV